MTEEIIQKLQTENTHLRAALAVSKEPCVYCQLPSDEMAKCKAGFPGCARMDDISGCPEFGAMMELAEAKKLLRTLNSVIHVMFEGPNGVLPETISTPLRHGLKIGELMRQVQEAIK